MQCKRAVELNFTRITKFRSIIGKDYKIHWSYFQIAGCQPTRLFQTRYARFLMLKNVKKNQFKILNAYKL